MKVSALFLFIVSAILNFQFAWGQNQDVARVIDAHEKALYLTKTYRFSPPESAWVWAFANEAASSSAALFRSSPEEAPKVYHISFIRALNLFLAFKNINAYVPYTELNHELIRFAEGVTDAKWRIHAAKLQLAFNPTMPTVASGPGVWGPLSGQNPLLPNWGVNQLWSAHDVNQMTAGLTPIAINSKSFVMELQEVYLYGGEASTFRTEDQTIVAKFWAGGAGTVTPPGLWVQIGLSRIKNQHRNSFAQSIKLMRVLTAALSDASVAAWSLKYKYMYWRPIQAIHYSMTTSWKPLLNTPPFPGFVSGHSTFSSAAASVLSVLSPLASGEALIITSEDMPQVARRFSSYHQAAEEAGKSRIFGGIHFECDNKDGLKLGSRAACAVLTRELPIANCYTR